MRKAILLMLLLIAALTLGAAALAGDPAIPADEVLVKELLPDDTLVEGNIVDKQMRLLMRKADNTLVFVGAVQDTSGEWHLTESTPLPEGTILGVENFVHSLGIPSDNYYDCISVHPYADFTWGVSLIYPNDGSMFLLGRNWISDEIHAFDGVFGVHPWSDVTSIDWSTLPDSYEEALAALDISSLAVVGNPDPADRLHLRAKPDRSAESLGKFYNGTPVIVTERGKEWTKVTAAGMEGWMMTKYLVFGEESVEYAGPWLDQKQEETQIFSAANDAAFLRVMSHETFFVIGVYGEEWYIIWLPDSDEYAFVHQDALWPGNG